MGHILCIPDLLKGGISLLSKESGKPVSPLAKRHFASFEKDYCIPGVYWMFRRRTDWRNKTPGNGYDFNKPRKYCDAEFHV
jgi:hypothetical protein